MVLNLLEFSTPINLNLIASYELAVQFYDAVGISGYRNKRVAQLQVLLANLLTANMADKRIYLVVSLANSSYQPNSRYNRKKIGKSFITLIKHLAEAGLLELHKGFIDRATKYVRKSRIRLTDKALELLKAVQAYSYMIAYDANTECIILRDEHKQYLEYSDTSEIITNRQNLTAYNNLLHRTLIDNPSFPQNGVHMKDGRLFNISPSDKFVRRIYNRSSFDWNGRFFGGWWQRMPKQYRNGIQINGSQTCEIDFAAIHIVLLYAIEGVDYWQERKIDPYLLDGFDESPEIRNLLKVIVLVAVNAKDRAQAVNALRHKIFTTDREQFSWFIDSHFNLENILDLFVEKHKVIKKQFFSSDTFSVMKIDSEIADFIINHFTGIGIPVLGIHDSFIIDNKYEGDLKKIMQEACRYVLQKRFNTHIIDTKIGFEGIDISGFTDLLRTNRQFFNDMFFNDRYTDKNIKRRQEVRKHRTLVGDQDYYF